MLHCDTLGFLNPEKIFLEPGRCLRLEVADHGGDDIHATVSSLDEAPSAAGAVVVATENQATLLIASCDLNDGSCSGATRAGLVRMEERERL